MPRISVRICAGSLATDASAARARSAETTLRTSRKAASFDGPRSPLPIASASSDVTDSVRSPSSNADRAASNAQRWSLSEIARRQPSMRSRHAHRPATLNARARRFGSSSRSARGSATPGSTACIAQAASATWRRHGWIASSSGFAMPRKAAALIQPKAEISPASLDGVASATASSLSRRSAS